MSSRSSKLFGITAQNTLLVGVLVGLVGAVLPPVLDHIAGGVVYDHELLDLADETRGRAWAILDAIDLLRQDSGELARLWEEHGADEQDTERLLDRMRDQYLRIEVRSLQELGQAGDANAKNDLGGWAEWRPELDAAQVEILEILKQADSSRRLVTSRIVRDRRTLTDEAARRNALGCTESYYVIWAATRLRNTEHGSSGGPSKVLMVGLSMDGSFRRIIGSTRHLGMVWQGEEILVHPFGKLSAHDDASTYVAAANDLFGKVRAESFEGDDDELLKAETRRVTIAPTAPGLTVLSDRNVELTFCESREIPGFSPGDSKKAAEALRRLNAEWIEDDWSERDPILRRVWGFDETRHRIRLLSSDPDRLEELQAAVLDRLAETFPDRSFSDTTVRWLKPVPCKTCDVSLVRVKMDLDSEDDSRSLMVGRAQFKEEVVADLNWQLAPLYRLYWVFVAVAVALAMVCSLVITRPLNRMSQVALAIADTSSHGNSPDWIKTVARAEQMLATSRRDEIGILASAFRRMLREVCDRHTEILALNRELDARVQERTAQLLETNDVLEGKVRELLEARNAQARFVASISHDLKTPLTTIKGYCELLTHSSLSPEQRDDLKTIYFARERLQRLIEDIIDSQRIELGQLKLDLEEFDVVSLIAEVCRGMNPAAAKNGNTLSIDSEEGMPAMYSDGDKLARMLTNLVSNACKFTSGGEVAVRAICESRLNVPWLVLEVHDTGRGIDPAVQDRVFTPFPQILDKRDNPDGTGLGLSNCKGYCEAMGGSIHFRSELGKGTTFTIELPFRAGGEVSGRQQPGREPAVRREFAAWSDGSLQAAPTVLVVDDDPEVQTLLRRFLEGLGFTVLTANSGREGVRLAAEKHPTLITLDVLMEDGDGWNALKELKADEELSDIPVIMVSVLDDKYKAFALGATDYVTKPIDWKQLSRTLDHFRTPAETRKVLVIDDDPDLRELVRRHLHPQGWQVFQAANGCEALDVLAEVRPDTILLDLCMPEMDGFELLHRLRKNGELRSIPVVVITAKDLTQTDRDWLNDRVLEVLRKDAIDWEELEAEIRRVVSRPRSIGGDSTGEIKT